jgi:hypothetical protein
VTAAGAAWVLAAHTSHNAIVTTPAAILCTPAPYANPNYRFGREAALLLRMESESAMCVRSDDT